MGSRKLEGGWRLWTSDADPPSEPNIRHLDGTHIEFTRDGALRIETDNTKSGGGTEVAGRQRFTHVPHDVFTALLLAYKRWCKAEGIDTPFTNGTTERGTP